MKTKDCKLRYGVRFNDSLRTIYLCRERAKNGLFLRHWRCVGLGHAKCPAICMTKYAPDVASAESAEPDSGLESVPAVESDTQLMKP